MTDRLKPCPFCGGEVKMITQKHREYPSTYYVYCKHCRCKSIETQCRMDVIEAWNTRKPIDRIEKQVSEIADRISNYCEEIDLNIPEEERSGYKMLPDILALKNVVKGVQNDL